MTRKKKHERKPLLPVAPAIMELPIWQELRTFITPLRNSMRSRASFHSRVLPPDLEKRAFDTWVKCGHPKCEVLMRIIRKHRNGKSWCIHVTGPGTKHENCRYGKVIQAQVLALQLDLKQAENSPRIKQAMEDTRQRWFRLNKKGELE